jgi:hypothetical protein
LLQNKAFFSPANRSPHRAQDLSTSFLRLLARFLHSPEQYRRARPRDLKSCNTSRPHMTHGAEIGFGGLPSLFL